MSGCSLELKHRMEYALNMLLQRCNWKPFWVDPMGLLSTVRSTGKPAAGQSMLVKMDRGWYDDRFLSGLLDCWNQAGIRCTVDFGQSEGGAECRFPEVPVAKRFIGQFCRKMHWLFSSLCGEYFQPEDLELWIYFLKGREKGGAPLLFKGYNQSRFWLLNCELWPYIIFFFGYFWIHLWLEKCIPCE